MTGTVDLAREASAEAPAAAEIEARTPLELFWRRLREDRVAIASLGFIVFMVLCAVCAPLIIKLVGARPPNAQSTKYLDSFGTPTGPSKDNIFGVDPLGRDVFSRVLYGARVSLEVAIVATALSVLIGVVTGMVAGFYRGSGRLADLAPDRRSARVPDPAAGHRPRGCLLAGRAASTG